MFNESEERVNIYYIGNMPYYASMVTVAMIVCYIFFAISQRLKNGLQVQVN